MLGRAKRIDPGKDRMSPSGVLHGTSGMERDQILAIRSQLLVDLEGLPRNFLVALLGFIRMNNSRKAGVEEGKTLSAEVTHGNASRWHNGHESIEQKVRCISGLLLQRSSTGDVLDSVLGRVKEAVTQPGSHKDTSEQSQGLVPVHPKSLLRLWGLLGLQDCIHREEMWTMSRER